jgi:hypothetical protein
MPASLAEALGAILSATVGTSLGFALPLDAVNRDFGLSAVSLVPVASLQVTGTLLLDCVRAWLVIFDVGSD